MSEKRISFTLNSLVREMNSQADAMLRSRFSITYSQFRFLQALAGGQQIDVTRLAELLTVTKGAVSKRLAWFGERGLIESTHSTENAKTLLVSLTAKGLSLAEESANFLDGSFTSHVSEGLSIDLSALNTELQEILVQMRQAKL